MWKEIEDLTDRHMAIPEHFRYRILKSAGAASKEFPPVSLVSREESLPKIIPILSVKNLKLELQFRDNSA